jgi:hypothetical protein
MALTRSNFLILLLSAFGCTQALAQPRVVEVSPGIELLEREFKSPEKVVPVSLIRINPSILKPKTLVLDPPGKISDAVRNSGLKLGINANFFDPSSRPLGLIISNGKRIRPLHRGGSLLTGVFLLTERGPEIIARENDYDYSQVLEAIQAGPLLIQRSQQTVIKERGDSTRRSAIAITRERRILVIATRNRFPGLTLTELQIFLSDPEFRVTSALNLDGGASSQLFMSVAPGVDLFGGEVVPVGVGF